MSILDTRKRYTKFHYKIPKKFIIKYKKVVMYENMTINDINRYPRRGFR